MNHESISRALELVRELERLLENQHDPKVRIAEAMVCALRQELENLGRRPSKPDQAA